MRCQPRCEVLRSTRPECNPRLTGSYSYKQRCIMIIYKWFAIAQARHPRAVGRLMRLATSTVPKLVGHKHGGGSGDNVGGAVSGVSVADASMGERGNPGMAPHETDATGATKPTTTRGTAVNPVVARGSTVNPVAARGSTVNPVAARGTAVKPQRDPSRTPQHVPSRTNGIRAANYAARVPGAR